MSRVIEREVTALEFDSTAFKAGINSSLKDLDRMKAGLKLDGVAKGFENLERAANNTKFSGFGNSVEGVTARLSAMGAVGFTIISRLTNAVIDGTKNMFAALVTTPMKTGLEEYETQLNAIQTILSNTRKEGTELKDVNAALDQLNRYADLTIYNFTEMTKNIGTFTAAGVELQTSVDAIKGIANLGAISGSNSQQVSTAMYQISQALSSGTVKLMDWNSIVNAGMGGEVFKQLLIDVGNVTGTIDDHWADIRNLTDGAEVSADNFRNTLSAGWLTSDVLLTSLKAISGEMTAIELMDMGFTGAQAEGIIALGQDAVAAATQVKTFTQLIDVAKEAMQSGWTQTWRMLIGDFDQAKELFGGISNVLGEAIATSAESRNRFWHVWVTRGGREDAIQAIHDAFTTIVNTVNNFKSAVGDVFEPFKGFQLYNITKAIGDFIEKLKMASESGERFKSIVRGVASIFDILKMLVLAVLEPILGLSDGASDAASGFIDLLASSGDWLFALRNMLAETGYFSTAVANVISWVKDLASRLGTMYTQFMKLEEVQKVLSFFRQFTWERILEFFQQLRDLVPIIVQHFEAFRAKIRELVDRFLEFVDTVRNIELVQKILGWFEEFDGSKIVDFFTNLRGKFDWVQTAFSGLKTIVGGLFLGLTKLGPMFSDIAEGIGNVLGTLIEGVSDKAGDIDWQKLLQTINTGILGALLLGLNSLVRGSFLETFFESLFGAKTTLGGGILDTLNDLRDTLSAYQNNLKADTLIKIAGAIALITASAFVLSTVDADGLTRAVIAIGVMMAELFAGMKVLAMLSAVKVVPMTVAVVAMATGLLILSAAISRLGSLDNDELAQGLMAVGLVIVGLVTAMRVLAAGPIISGVLSASAAMVLMSISLVIMAGAVALFGSIPYTKLEQGLIAIGIALTGLVIFSKTVSGPRLSAGAVGVGLMAGAIYLLSLSVSAMGSIPWKNMVRGLAGMAGALTILAVAVKVMNSNLLGAATIAIVSGAIILLAQGMTTLGNMSWEQILRAGVALAATLTILGVAVTLMSGSLLGAAAILVVSAALVILAQGLTILGKLTWEQILRGLVALAAALAILGIAGALLTPVIPSLIGLGIAMALVGVGALALGLGLVLVAAGLTALGASAGVIAAGIVILAGAIISVLPAIGLALALAVTNFIMTIAEQAPVLLEAAKTLLLVLIDAIVEVTPAIVEGLLTLLLALLEAIADKLPDMLEAGFEIVLSILEGIADNIEAVVEAGLEIATEFIHGLTDGIPDLVEAGFEFVVALVTAIGEALVENAPILVENAITTAGWLIAGLVEGLWNGLTNIVEAASELGKAALQAFLDIFKINSPAKTTIEIGGHVAQGLVEGLVDGTRNVIAAATRLATEVQNGMTGILSTIETYIDDDWSLYPTVTPVLDMSTLRRGINGINGSFASSKYAMSLGRSMDRSESSVNSDDQPKPPDDDGGAGSVTFVQYNHSPKALNTTEIYRQTRSQIAKLNRRIK